MRSLKLFWHFCRVNVLNELQYRVNFFIQILQSGIALVVGLVGLGLVFSHTTDLAGWTRPQLLAVMGVHILMGAIIRATIQPNMQRLMEDIQEGTFDFVLTRPADAQALVSVREFRFWQIVDVALGLIVLGWAAVEMRATFDVLTIGAFLLALLFGGLMLYSFWLMLTTVAFWVIRMDQMINLFEGLYAAGRWPVGIYPDWLRYGLTFLVPVAFAVTVPAEALTQRLTPETLLGAGAFAALLFILARLLWRQGLKAYSGASA